MYLNVVARMAAPTPQSPAAGLGAVMRRERFRLVRGGRGRGMGQVTTCPVISGTGANAICDGSCMGVSGNVYCSYCSQCDSLTGSQHICYEMPGVPCPPGSTVVPFTNPGNVSGSIALPTAEGGAPAPTPATAVPTAQQSAGVQAAIAAINKFAASAAASNVAPAPAPAAVAPVPAAVAPVYSAPVSPAPMVGGQTSTTASSTTSSDFLMNDVSLFGLSIPVWALVGVAGVGVVMLMAGGSRR